MAIGVGNYPGVFPTITDLSQVTQATSTSVIAAVGEARKGSVFKRRLVTSSSQLATLFGKPDVKYGYMEHCMTCALEEAGESYVVRVVGEDSLYGAVKVPAEGEELSKASIGYNLTQVENKDDDSFWYNFTRDEGGNLEYELDKDGNNVSDDSTLFTILAENPNEEDIRVRLEETTVLPSNTKAKSTVATKKTEDEDDFSYVVTVKNANGIKAGDRVVITNCPASEYNGTFDVTAATPENVIYYEVKNSDGGIFYSKENQPEYSVAVKTNVNDGQQMVLGWTKVTTGEHRYVGKEVVSYYYNGEEAGFQERTIYITPENDEVTPEDYLDPGYWYVVIKKAESEQPDSELYYVYGGMDPADHALSEICDVYKLPDLTLEPLGKYSSAKYDLLVSDGGVRFLKEGTKYSERVTGGLIDLKAEKGQFYYLGIDEYFLKVGSEVYLTQDMTDLARSVVNLTDENGRVFDGAAFLAMSENRKESDKHRYAKTGTLLYTDKELLKFGAMVVDPGSYEFTGDTGEVVSNGFQYELNLNSALSNLTPQSGLRFVKVPDNRDRKFDLSVYELVDGTLNLVESFTDCTLYSGLDGYGNQTKVSTKVNNNSEYIQIVMNEVALSGEDKFPRMLTTNEGKLTGGYCSSAISSTDLMKGWDLFSDTEQVTVNVLLHCGYAAMGGDEDGASTPVEQKMLSLATSRRDCFAVLDIPSNKVRAEDAADYRKNILGIDSYRAGLYSPWVEVYDSYSGVNNVVLPPSGFIGQVMARTDNVAGVWSAPAGLNRGQISCAMLNPVGLTAYYDEGQQGVVYTGGINYLRKTSGVYVVWGQKTLQFKASAMDRINVARLVFYIETTLKNAAKWHLFEQNTAYRRAQVTMQFDSFLSNIKAAGGLYDYKVVCDETNNDDETRANNQMNIDIYLQPEYAAEFIRLQTVVQKAGATVGIM